MRKCSVILAAATLLVSTGIASAQSRNYDSSGAPKSSGSSPRSGGGLATGAMTGSGETTGMTGAPSSTNPQSGRAGGLQSAPHQVPENGSAPNSTALDSNAR